MPTRAEMMAAVNATRPGGGTPSTRPSSWSKPLSEMSDEELRHWAYEEGDVSRRREIAAEIARRQSGSSTADLANETRPIPEVPVADNGWKGGKFNWDAANQEVRDSQARAKQEEAERQAGFESRYGDGTYDYRGAADSVRRDRGLRMPASEQEQLDAIRAAQIADLERRRDEEAALKAHNAQVAGLQNGSRSSDLDPVEAAGTPVTPDPPVRGKKPASKPRSGPYGRTVPGPVTVDGTPVAAPEAFASQQEADAYNTRRALSPDEAAPVTVNPLDAPQVGPDGMAASPRDIAMRNRGYVPIYGKDGSVTYALEAPSDGDNPGVGGPGRRGIRPDLTEGSPSTKANPMGTPGNYVPKPAAGPVGNQMVLRPTDEFKQQTKTAQEQRELNRLIETSGLPAQAVLTAYADGGINAARMAANGAKAQAGARRREAVVRQAQFAQRSANLLDNPTASDWTKRMVSEALLRSGRPGATPLDVEGQQMGNMQQVMQQMATGYATTLQQNPQMEMLRQQQEQKLDMDAAAHADSVMEKMGYNPLTGLGSWSGQPMTEDERRRVAIAVERRYPGRGLRIASNIPVGAPAAPGRGAPGPAAPSGE